MVLGGMAFFFCPPLFGVAGIVLAAVALSKGERNGTTAMAVAVAGTVLGMLIGVVLLGS